MPQSSREHPPALRQFLHDDARAVPPLATVHDVSAARAVLRRWLVSVGQHRPHVHVVRAVPIRQESATLPRTLCHFDRDQENLICFVRADPEPRKRIAPVSQLKHSRYLSSANRTKITLVDLGRVATCPNRTPRKPRASLQLDGYNSRYGKV